MGSFLLFIMIAQNSDVGNISVIISGTKKGIQLNMVDEKLNLKLLVTMLDCYAVIW